MPLTNSPSMIFQSVLLQIPQARTSTRASYGPISGSASSRISLVLGRDEYAPHGFPPMSRTRRVQNKTSRVSHYACPGPLYERLKGRPNGSSKGLT